MMLPDIAGIRIYVYAWAQDHRAPTITEATASIRIRQAQLIGGNGDPIATMDQLIDVKVGPIEFGHLVTTIPFSFEDDDGNTVEVELGGGRLTVVYILADGSTVFGDGTPAPPMSGGQP